MKGTVKWYDRVKGYGFLQTEDDKDIFIHRSGLEVSNTELEAGQAVEFEVEQREKGPVAIKGKKSRLILLKLIPREAVTEFTASFFMTRIC